MNSLIPIEEAIYYLEETLRESSQLRRCYTPKATIFQNWLIGVNNTLTIIFGANSLQNTSFCGLDFGEKDEDESAYRMKMFNGIRMALSSIREYIVELKRQVSKNSFSRDCFVAMWFDPCMEERYHIGIACRKMKEIQESYDLLVRGGNAAVGCSSMWTGVLSGEYYCGNLLWQSGLFGIILPPCPAASNIIPNRHL